MWGKELKSAVSQHRMEIFGFLIAGAFYITTSAGMIAFNKYLLRKSRFPYVVFLVFIHSGFGSLMALLLRLTRPSLFPSLTCSSRKVHIDRHVVIHSVLPIAAMFAMQLVLTNEAYLHSSVTFMQMLKECNVVMVYGISLLAGLEVFSWMNMRVLLLITCATLMTIKGELHFSPIGFLVQGIGQTLECAKIVLQVLLLTKSCGKIDPLSYTLLLSPICCLCLGILLALSYYVEPAFGLHIPHWSEVAGWLPLLLLNASLAFLLNVSAAIVMSYGSAMALVLAGVVKDVVIVWGGATLMGEHVSALQIFAFFTQVALVWVWSMMKTFPDNFKNGFMSGIPSLFLTIPEKQIDETTRLQSGVPRSIGP